MMRQNYFEKPTRAEVIHSLFVVEKQVGFGQGRMLKGQNMDNEEEFATKEEYVTED